MEQETPNDTNGVDARSKSQPRIRRRNRMITSCLECRRRKLKCDKLHPCTNCNKFSRDCLFLAPALDSVSQQKLNELKEKMGSLERALEQDVVRPKSSKDSGRRESSGDIPGEADSSSDNDDGVPEDEKDLEPTPLAVADAFYGDDANDDVLDLGIKIGKMRMNERLGGFFRPRMSEEIGATLGNPESDRRTPFERAMNSDVGLNDATDFLEPGPTYIAPGEGLILGNVGDKRSLLEFLPSRNTSDTLVLEYYSNVHFLARVVHWPSFQLQYENFWTNVLAGIEPAPSLQALVLSVMFAAIASMQDNTVATLFARPKKNVLNNLQAGTEIALTKAHFLRTTRIETLQAFVIYLIPMCRDQMSRAHSVLVGAAIRLAECMGLHRDPADGHSLPPVETHVRRILWHQIAFLDVRTAETQGPRPSIRRDTYDTRFPININDIDLLSSKPQEVSDVWTDMTLSRIRFECNEMHRVVIVDRERLEKKKISITHVLGKIESFRKAMEAKYRPIFDDSIPIRKLARLVMSTLLLRMHIMVLHRYYNNWTSKIPDRLTQIILSSGTQVGEDSIKMERSPDLAQYRWHIGALQNWHVAFLLLIDIHTHPNRREADRIWSVLDYVFEPDLSLSRDQKARSILSTMQTRTAIYRDIRKARMPDSMKKSLKETPHPLFPENAPRTSTTNISSIQNQNPDTSWSFDSPSTFIMPALTKDDNAVPGVHIRQQTSYDTSLFHPTQLQNQYPQHNARSPSTSSTSDAYLTGNNMEQRIWHQNEQLYAGLSPPSISGESNNSPFNIPYIGLEDINQQATQGQQQPRMSRGDSIMLDIDWAEWDKIFPPDVNTGNLDAPNVANMGMDIAGRGVESH